jgi:hypothetical protein
MKRIQEFAVIITSAAFFLLGADYSSLYAQQTETLFDGEVSHGGFGGPVVKFSEIAGSAGVWVGGRGGWIINLSELHTISLGGADMVWLPTIWPLIRKSEIQKPTITP